MPNKQSAVIAYVPVLHAGYIQFFHAHPTTLYLIGQEMICELAKDFSYYGRDIRALDTTMMRTAISALNIFSHVEELTSTTARALSTQGVSLIAPDEDITREVAQRYFLPDATEFKSVFLRWDRKITEREYEVNPDHAISNNSQDREFIKLAQTAAQRSSDWWRQIGALLVKEGEILYTEHNRHLPNAHSPYAFGDPKNNYNVGESPDYYTSIHAESAIIARAAKDGAKLAGTSLYTTTFPCPNCARLICVAGIQKLYYAQGHSALDAEPLLKKAGIEIIYIPAETIQAAH